MNDVRVVKVKQIGHNGLHIVDLSGLDQVPIE